MVLTSIIYLIFACLKVFGVGIRKDGNKYLGAYLGFRYTLFFIYLMLFVVLIVYLMGVNPGPMQLTLFLTAIGYFLLFLLLFILQTGPIVLLHGIRGNRQNSAETEENTLPDEGDV